MWTTTSGSLMRSSSSSWTCSATTTTKRSNSAEPPSWRSLFLTMTVICWLICSVATLQVLALFLFCPLFYFPLLLHFIISQLFPFLIWLNIYQEVKKKNEFYKIIQTLQNVSDVTLKHIHIQGVRKKLSFRGLWNNQKEYEEIILSPSSLYNCTSF